ncbi:MAG: hypothetical protein JXD22_05210 [Sedimentisphaerales bacterium]|nr:hypothetical protein [Sedimentisphaerales bacterium]
MKDIKSAFRFVIVLVVLIGAACAGGYFYLNRKMPLHARAKVEVCRLQPAVKDVKKVLLVHSYHTGYPWVDAITRGVKMALSGDKQIDLQVFYMDTKRITDKSWKQQAGEKAKEIVRQWNPDVVIAADDNAQIYFAKSYVGCERPIVIFCGVNAKPEAYGYPASNVTGVLERPHFQASLDFLKELRPYASRVAIVTDDSETSAGAIAFIKTRPSTFEIVSCETPSTFDGWQQAILQCQDRADAIAVYMYHTVKRAGDQVSMLPKEVMNWTVGNSRLPVIGFFIFAVDDGALCGYLESGVEHGLKAGQMALGLLRGDRIDQHPIITALEGQSMVNLKVARQLGIEVSGEVIEKTDVVIED